jgi:hypothetical protein
MPNYGVEGRLSETAWEEVRAIGGYPRVDRWGPVETFEEADAVSQKWYDKRHIVNGEDVGPWYEVVHLLSPGSGASITPPAQLPPTPPVYDWYAYPKGAQPQGNAPVPLTLAPAEVVSEPEDSPEYDARLSDDLRDDIQDLYDQTFAEATQ